jgi:hypothetical protein
MEQAAGLGMYMLRKKSAAADDDDDENDSNKIDSLDPQPRDLHMYCRLCAKQKFCICHVLTVKSQAFFTDIN